MAGTMGTPTRPGTRAMTLSSLLQNQFVTRGILLTALVTILTVALAAWIAARNRTSQCTDNLHVVHSALMEYHQLNGHLPTLAFFPDDAQLDPDSLYAELAPFGVQPSHCLCPSAPPSLSTTGMTYIWNVAANNTRLGDLPQDAWLLVEVHALSSSVRPPHQGRYNVLYPNGSIRPSRVPPAMP